jgi:hypothetical protein
VKNRSLTLSIPHRLTQAEARARLQKGIAELRAKHGKNLGEIHETWTPPPDHHADFRLSAMGQSITGQLDVEPDAVKLSVDLPWMISLFAEKLQPQIEAEGRKMLE